MNAGIILLPVLSAVLGAGFAPLFVYLYVRPSRIRRALAPMLTDPSLVTHVLPEAEAHVDHFLRNRLSTAMPMVAMFIGEKTIAQMKGIFMEELETLFPVFLGTTVDQVLITNGARIRKQFAISSIAPGTVFGAAIGLAQCGFYWSGLLHSIS
jgi:hypothetical protein